MKFINVQTRYDPSKNNGSAQKCRCQFVTQRTEVSFLVYLAKELTKHNGGNWPQKLIDARRLLEDAFRSVEKHSDSMMSSEDLDVSALNLNCAAMK